MNGVCHGLGNKGFVVIYVLWVSAAVTAMALFLSRDTRRIVRTEASMESRRLLQTEVISLRDIFAHTIRNRGFATPYRNLLGNCTVEVADANYFLDLNRAGFEEIKRLCISLDIDGYKAEIIADSLWDWMDSDDLSRLKGAESDYYESLYPPYECKNAPIEGYEELRLIRGIDERVYQKIKPHISFAGTGINFQHASAEVIYAIIGDRAISERLVEHRKEHELDDEALRMLLGRHLYDTLLTRYTLSGSGHYRLTVTGNAGEVEEKTVDWISRVAGRTG